MCVKGTRGVGEVQRIYYSLLGVWIPTGTVLNTCGLTVDWQLHMQPIRNA